MKRLTSNKEVSEMNVIELAYNSCYARDGKARYRDFEDDFDARELAIKLLEKYADIPNEFTCDEDFDDFMADALQYGTDDSLGLIAVFYKNLWAMADLREHLKKYEDLEDRLQAVYGNCDGLLEKVVEHLEQHRGVDFTSPATKARMLTDEDVDRWEEYKTLEEQGKLLKLPCKMGDITYWISGQDEYGNKIPSIRKNNPVIGIAVQEDGFYILCDGDDEYQKVGERWSLLTREDAEDTLKEL